MLLWGSIFMIWIEPSSYCLNIITDSNSQEENTVPVRVIAHNFFKPQQELHNSGLIGEVTEQPIDAPNLMLLIHKICQLGKT